MAVSGIRLHGLPLPDEMDNDRAGLRLRATPADGSCAVIPLRLAFAGDFHAQPKWFRAAPTMKLIC